MKKPVTFCGITANPGTKTNGNAAILDSGYSMPTTVINGSFEGPTMLITSGVHGSEYPCIETAIEISREINPAEIHGQIVIIHPVNTQAFIQRRMYVVPQDGKNINRMFPGKKDGTLAEQTAYVISEEFQSKADYQMDLHGGDVPEILPVYAIYPKTNEKDVVDKSLDMAQALHIEYLLSSDLWGACAQAASFYHHIPAILVECGGRGLWSKEEIEIYKTNVHNVLKHLKIEEGEPDLPAKSPVILYGEVGPKASEDGCWYPCVSLGDRVKKGEKIGELRDFFGDLIEEVFSEVNGVVFMSVVSLAVNKGAPLISIGIDQP